MPERRARRSQPTLGRIADVSEVERSTAVFVQTCAVNGKSMPEDAKLSKIERVVNE